MALYPLPSVLVTDDDRDLRETLGVVLEARGYHPLLAADGEEAVRIVSQEEVHLVLVDLHLPRWSGIETVQRVREVHQEMPCIMMSAAWDEANLAAARSMDVFSMLSKPLGQSQVTDSIQRALSVAYDW